MKTKLYLILFFFLVYPKLFFAQTVVNNKAEAKNTLQKAIRDINNLNCKSSLENSKKVLQYGLQYDDFSYVAKAYNIIGLNYEEFSDLNKAIYYYEKGIEYAYKANDIQLLDFLHNNLGNVYFFRLNDPKKGLTYYLKCYSYAKRNGVKNDIAYAEVNIADANMQLGNFKTAKIFLDRIQLIAKVSEDFEILVTFHSLLGKYYSNVNDKKNAEINYNIVINKLKIGDKNFLKANELEMYDEIYTFYKKYKNIPKALLFLEMHDSLQDVVYVKERNQEIKFSNSSIEVVEMNNKIQKIASEKKVQDEKMSASSSMVKMSLFLKKKLTMSCFFAVCTS